MKYQDHFEVHVPNTVMQRTHTGLEQMNDGILSLVSSLAEKYQDTDQNEVNRNTVSTRGGYQTATKINFLDFQHPAVRQLKDDVIYPAVETYLQRHMGKQALEQLNPWVNAWSNLLKTGHWQAPHCHPSHGTVASGCYYVQYPDDIEPPAGNIEFINPIPESWHHGFPFSRRIEPAAGMLLLFPPWYVHYVHPFTSSQSRCIVAFDVLPHKPGANLVF